MPAREVILIIGLPASGKTTLANKLAKQGDRILNDPESTWDVASYGFRTISKLYITDPMLCINSVKKTAYKLIKRIFPAAKIKEIQIPRDKEKSVKNAKKRGDYLKVKFSINLLNQCSEERL